MCLERNLDTAGHVQSRDEIQRAVTDLWARFARNVEVLAKRQSEVRRGAALCFHYLL